MALAILAIVAAASVRATPSRMPAAAPAVAGRITGRVTETMNADRYTYVRVDAGRETVWAAAPAFQVKVGERVTFTTTMPMRNFKSRALDRSFDLVYFAGKIESAGSDGEAPGKRALPEGHPPLPAGPPAVEPMPRSGGLPAGHPPLPGAADRPVLPQGHPPLTGAPAARVTAAAPDVPIERAPGGMTIAELYAAADSLAGSNVVVRGQVMRLSTGILGRNWLHLADGSGGSGSNDLCVTCRVPVGRGDIVTVSGTVAVDRDLGSGYRYDVIVEDAAVTENRSRIGLSMLSTASGASADPDAFLEAGDCGACHTTHYEQWLGSAHQAAHEDGLYRAFAELAREDAGEEVYRFCSSCHAPLAVATGEIEPGAAGEATFLTREGVTCDACHTVDRVDRVHATGGANASLVIEDAETRFGPIRDPAESDLHPSQFSETHTRADFCSACHTLVHPLNGLVIENTLAEWRAGPYAAAGIQCQDCHMRTVDQAQRVARTMKPLKVAGRAADDGELRPDVHAHLFVGGSTGAYLGIGSNQVLSATRRLQSAAVLDLRLPRRAAAGGAVEVSVDVTNVGAGHAIPTSITELRQVWIELTVNDGTGAVVHHSGGIRDDGSVDPAAPMFHAKLADASGNLTYLPWRAVTMTAEKLIGPKETASELYSIPIPAGTKGPLQVRAALHYRSAPQDALDELFGKGRFHIRAVEMASASGEIPLGWWQSLRRAWRRR